jgi:hypothetical protein
MTRFCKIITFLIVLSSFPLLNLEAQVAGFPKISIDLQDVSIVEALDSLARKQKITIAYSPSIFKTDTRCNINVTNADLGQVLDRILKDQWVAYEISADRKQVVLFQKTRKLVTLSGFIEDKNSGEKLIGANIIDQISGIGTATNEYGFFSLTFLENEVHLRISYLGYSTLYFKKNIQENLEQNFQLKPNLTLEEVIVTGTLPGMEPGNLQKGGFQEINVEEMAALPTLGGEVDVMRMMDLLPGVQTGPDGIGGLHVRGGNADQNLVLLDGVPVYNGAHLLGVYSMFNDFSIQKASLQKSDFDARHGGRLSSVMDIRMREGNKKEYHGGVGLGILTTKATFEGPIQKDKSSFMLSGRRVFWDWLIGAALNNSSGLNDDQFLKYFFYDWNAKVNHSFSQKDRVFLSFFRGGDKFEYGDGSDEFSTQDFKSNVAVNWDNSILAARWNHVFSGRLFANSTFNFSRFNFRFRNYDHSFDRDSMQSSNLFFDLNLSSIIDYTLKTDLDYYYSPEHLVKLGGIITLHNFEATSVSAGSLGFDEGTFGNFDFGTRSDPDKLQEQYLPSKISAVEAAVYIEDNYEVNDWLALKAGMFFTGFFVEDKTYLSFQPRLSSYVNILKGLSWQTSYSRMSQFLHLVTGSNIGLPSDLWVPATNKIAPQEAWQVSSGLNYSDEKGLQASVEAYYKKMNNVLSFNSTEDVPVPPGITEWEDMVVSGEGLAYGLESMINLRKGKSSGMLSYTLSWADRQYDAFNNGERYPFKYDRRHYIKFAYLFKFGKKFEMGMNWVYGSGNPFTPKEGEFSLPNLGTLRLYAPKNSVRLPAYHRMDLSFNFIKKKKHGVRTWNLSIYNVYNHRNPFWIYQENNAGQSQVKQLSILPIFPSFTYSYQF